MNKTSEMTRRGSLRNLRTGVMLLVGMMWGTCVQVWGAVSRWSWRGYPSEAALRSHLKTSSNHLYISNREVDAMTFEECIAYHEKDHVRRKDKPRWSQARQVPGTRRVVTQRRSPVAVDEMEARQRDFDTGDIEGSPGQPAQQVLDGRWNSSHGILEIAGDRFVFWGGPRRDEQRNAGTIIVRGNRYILEGSDRRAGLFVIEREMLTLHQTAPSSMSQQLRRLH